MATRIRSKSTSGKSVTHARKPPPPNFSDNLRQQPVPLSALAGHGAAGPAAEERLLPGHDGLIEIASLHQPYALRWDLDGDRTGGEPVALPHFSRLPDFSRLPGAELGGPRTAPLL